MAESGSITLLALDIDGVLTDGKVTYSADGQEQKSISMRDIDAIFAARRHGLQVALVTGEDTPWVEFLSHRLQVEHTLRGAKDKLEAVEGLARQARVPLSKICYVGDADRDALALEAVGLGMAPADATPRARVAAQVVLRAAGGSGAVHEAVSLLLEAATHPGEVDTQRHESDAPSAGLDLESSAVEFREIVADSMAIKQAMADRLAPAIARAADAISGALKVGGKLLIFGNGGSAADAQHFAAEFVGRFEQERAGLAAIALTTDTSVLSALSNDYGVDVLFARQIEALARPGDIAVAISTSGTSCNVIEGVEAAARIPVYTIGMTGRTGGSMADLVDLCICVPSDRTARIQEAHGLILHAISGLVESHLANSESRSGGHSS